MVSGRIGMGKLAVILLSGCGPNYYRYTLKQPIPENVLSIIEARCATSGCHLNGAFEDLTSDGAALKRTNSANRISDGTMPTPGSREVRSFGDDEKETLLTYLEEE
jgi:hypothetical protein